MGSRSYKVLNSYTGKQCNYWFSLTIVDSLWPLLIPCDPYWFLVAISDSCGHYWFPGVSIGSQWPLLIPCGHYWFPAAIIYSMWLIFIHCDHYGFSCVHTFPRLHTVPHCICLRFSFLLYIYVCFFFTSRFFFQFFPFPPSLTGIAFRFCCVLFRRECILVSNL